MNKKILFWIMFVPMGMIYIFAGFLTSIGEGLEEMCHSFENWCFNHAEHYTYMGGGWYRGKKDVPPPDYLPYPSKERNRK